MSRKLARSTGQSVKEGLTFLALLGSFLTDILTPLGAFSGGLAAVGFVALLLSGSLWAMRRFPDSTEDGHIAHSKWAVLASGGVTIICTVLYVSQLYVADVRSSQLGFLASHLPVMEGVQKKLTPKAHTKAIEDIRRGVHAATEAAERAEEAAIEASEQAQGARKYAQLAYQEVSYTNTPGEIRAMLQQEEVAPGIVAQLVRKYPFEEEISGSEALDVLQSFPDDYRRDLMEPLVKSVAPGMSAEAYLAFMRPLSSGQHIRDVASLINPKVTRHFDWSATTGFWQDCFDRFSKQTCAWKAYTIHPAFDALDGQMFVHITKRFVENGDTGNVMSALKARGATTTDLAPEYAREIRQFMTGMADKHPDRYLVEVADSF